MHIITKIFTTLFDMLNAFVDYFCVHRETETVKYYSYDSPWLSVWAMEICKKCGRCVELQKISKYYAIWNRENLIKSLEAKGIKSIEDL